MEKNEKETKKKRMLHCIDPSWPNHLIRPMRRIWPMCPAPIRPIRHLILSIRPMWPARPKHPIRTTWLIPSICHSRPTPMTSEGVKQAYSYIILYLYAMLYNSRMFYIDSYAVKFLYFEFVKPQKKQTEHL